MISDEESELVTYAARDKPSIGLLSKSVVEKQLLQFPKPR
jgi:hypothetical protein